MVSLDIKFNGERLKALRQSQNMTIDKFVKYLYINGLDISQMSVSNWESGISSPNLLNLLKLCEVLKVDVQYFFDQKLNLNNQPRFL